jgi:hypothetical protein
MNPWITHLKTYHASHPNLSYKEAMIAAKSSYTPIPKTKKVQKGKGEFAAEAKSIADTTKVLGDTSNKTIDFVAKNKENNGSYGASIIRKRSNLFKKLKNRMAKNTFPMMSDQKLLEYVDQEIHA